MSDRLETVLDEAERSLEALADTTDDDGIRSVVAELELLLRVVAEAQDLLETIDLSELPEAIDAEELRSAIDAGEIPAALAEDDGERVLALRRLLRAVKLVELWDAVDIGAFLDEKGEFDEAMDELAGEGGVLGETIERTTEAVSGGDDEGLFGEADEMGDDLEAAVRETFGSAEAALEDGDLHEYQAIIQAEAVEGIDEFREALIETHGALEAVYDRNRRERRRTDRGTHSRNPTAVSTLPLARLGLETDTAYSTVPRAVRYSTAPTRDRIYGRRFRRESEKRRREREEEADG